MRDVVGLWIALDKDKRLPVPCILLLDVAFYSLQELIVECSWKPCVVEEGCLIFCPQFLKKCAVVTILFPTLLRQPLSDPHWPWFRSPCQCAGTLSANKMSYCRYKCPDQAYKTLLGNNLPVRGVAALASVAHQAVSKVTKLLLSFSWLTHPQSIYVIT